MLSHLDWLTALECGAVSINPFVREHLQPASLDLTIDRVFRIPTLVAVTPRQVFRASSTAEEREQQWTRVETDAFLLAPQHFALGQTRERVSVSLAYALDIAGRSSLGRDGIFVHVQAGYADPGFNGRLTLELYNAAPWAYEFHAGDRICQARLWRLETAATRGYTGKYQGETEPLGSRTYMDRISDRDGSVIQEGVLRTV